MLYKTTGLSHLEGKKAYTVSGNGIVANCLKAFAK